MTDQMVPEGQTDAAVPEPPREEVGFGGRLAAIWMDPAKVFRNLTGKFDWLIIWAIIVAIVIGSMAALKPIIVEQQMTQLEERLREGDMAREQREQILDRARSQMEGPMMFIAAPVFITLAWFIVPLFLLFIGNILLGGAATYPKYLNVYSWSSIIAIPETIIKLPMMIMKDTAEISLGLGALVTRDSVGPFLHSFLSSFEIFTIWQIALVSIGLAVIAGTKTGKAAVWVVVAWLIWVLAKSGLSTLGMMMG